MGFIAGGRIEAGRGQDSLQSKFDHIVHVAAENSCPDNN